MLYFFTRKNHDFIQYAVSEYGQFDYIKRRYKIEINKAIDYLHIRNRPTNNINIFSRLLYLLVPDPANMTLLDVYKQAEVEGPYLARQFYFVSNISKGTVYNNVFYNDSYDVISSVTTEINLFELEKTWKHQQPLRVIYSNNTDLDYYVLDKKDNSTTKRINVVELDIPLMCLMYWHWCKERISADLPTNVNYFVYSYLLTNSIYSNIDIAIFNRFMKIWYHSKIDPYKIKLPISLYDPHVMVDNYLTWLANMIEKQSMRLEQILGNFQAINSKNMINVLYVNRPYPTRQSLWSLWFCRIKYINFLIDVMGERGMMKNKIFLNRLPVYIKALETGSTPIFDILPMELIEDFVHDLDELKIRVGKR